MRVEHLPLKEYPRTVLFIQIKEHFGHMSVLMKSYCTVLKFVLWSHAEFGLRQLGKITDEHSDCFIIYNNYIALRNEKSSWLAVAAI